jgi:hypothetical protein
VKKDTGEKEARQRTIKALQMIRSSNERDDFQSMKQKQPVSYGYPTRSVSFRIQSRPFRDFTFEPSLKDFSKVTAVLATQDEAKIVIASHRRLEDSSYSLHLLGWVQKKAFWFVSASSRDRERVEYGSNNSKEYLKYLLSNKLCDCVRLKRQQPKKGIRSFSKRSIEKIRLLPVPTTYVPREYPRPTNRIRNKR